MGISPGRMCDYLYEWSKMSGIQLRTCGLTYINGSLTYFYSLWVSGAIALGLIPTSPDA